jgi:phage shock protein PspC (stress-responsive transcriptional regulator)
MKKIININLSGRVIPIEDTAYEKLQNYIESLRRYFANEEGRDEIINDIESRIAELMNDKVRKGAACITDADVDEIVASMGRPEDFDETAEAASDSSGSQQTKQEYSYSSGARRRRLYRDANDKFLGGVCSGIANYLNTDPAIVRILFAIITFGGFGLGFLVYILLWMLLPSSDLESYGGKRLYRNPDDRVIGGVAGGLAAYFNTRAATLRLIFAAPLLLSILINMINGFTWHSEFGRIFPNIVFSSLTGTFILTYVILWIVLPEARSPYEKMEMRGEKVDVNTIRQNVQEGIGNMKDRMKSWSEEVKQSAENFGNRAKEFANTRGKSFATEVNETARHGGRGIGHAIAVLFKVFFLFIAGTIAFGLFVAVMALIFGGVAWWPINDFLWTSKWQQAYAWGTLIFFLLIPLVGFIIWLIRRIIGVRSRRSYLGWIFGFLWSVGWVCVVLLVASISSDFRTEQVIETNVPTAQPANGKMIVVVSEPELEYTGNFSWIDDNIEGFDLRGDTARLSTIAFRFVKSDDSAYHVKVRRFSHGRDEEEAQDRASRIQYRVSSKDSVLDLGNGYTVDRQSKFRNQRVEIEISIPAGKKIRFDPTVTDKLSLLRFRARGQRWRDRGVGIWVDDDYNERLRPNVDYVMDNNGTLKDTSGNRLETETDSGGYRYKEDKPVKPTLEEQRRKVQEEQDKLKQLQDEQDRNKSKQKSSTGMNESIDDRDEIASGSHSPVFSLVETLF